MVDIKVWMGELAEKLTGRFGDRLLRWSAAAMAGV